MHQATRLKYSKVADAGEAVIPLDGSPSIQTKMSMAVAHVLLCRLANACLLKLLIKILSSPLSDLSTDNLRFLSSRQALADLAHFRTVIAETKGLTNSKWLAFGGSYPGSLAAWFRLKYPHLVHASVATSAPVYATVNFPGIHIQILVFLYRQHSLT